MYLRTAYISHIENMLNLLAVHNQWQNGDIATEAQRIFQFETKLAEFSLTPEDERDPSNVYHKKTLQVRIIIQL